MSVKKKIDGITGDDFGIGFGSDYGIHRDTSLGVMTLRDLEVSERYLSDFLGWRIVPAGRTRVILSGFDHVVTEVDIESGGVLDIQSDGKLVLI
jgi:hypothetical protein